MVEFVHVADGGNPVDDLVIGNLVRQPGSAGELDGECFAVVLGVWEIRFRLFSTFSLERSSSRRGRGRVQRVKSNSAVVGFCA